MAVFYPMKDTVSGLSESPTESFKGLRERGSEVFNSGTFKGNTYPYTIGVAQCLVVLYYNCLYLTPSLVLTSQLLFL